MKIEVIGAKASPIPYTWSEVSDGRMTRLTIETDDLTFMHIFLDVMKKTVNDSGAMVHVWTNTGAEELYLFPEGHFAFQFTAEGIEQLDGRIKGDTRRNGLENKVFGVDNS
jgi:hypothetical protein